MNDYSTFYLKDLLPMIDRITLDLIRNSPEDEIYGETFCPTQIRLGVIFDFADQLKKALKGGEDDDS